jgi:hypothetical protein
MYSLPEAIKAGLRILMVETYGDAKNQEEEKSESGGFV